MYCFVHFLFVVDEHFYDILLLLFEGRDGLGGKTGGGKTPRVGLKFPLALYDFWVFYL